MKLIYHDDSKPKTYEEVYEKCQKGYGIKKPNLVNGFAGFFFRVPDIYAYGKLGEYAENDPKLEAALLEMVMRYKREDYGFISVGEFFNNVENRWLGGSSAWTIARYSLDRDVFRSQYACGIVLEIFADYGLLYFIDEDMREIYAKEHKDENYKQDIAYTGLKV